MAAKKPSASAMAGRTVQHATFVIERIYDAPPSLVFKAWADEEAKARWFGASGEWQVINREFDFRVGGRERLKGRWPNGRITAFDSLYQDIVTEQRIVYSYDMHIDGKRISVSLATIEFKPLGAGTGLTVTEQGVFLDGYDDAGSREQGTRALLDKLDAALRS